MKGKLAVLICSSVLLLSACTDRPDETAPTPPFGLQASYMEEGMATDSMAMVRPEGSASIGTASHIVKRGSVDGREVLHLILVQKLRAGTMRDSLIVDAATLLPIEYFNSMPGMQSIHTVYNSDGSVRSEIQRGDVSGGVDTLLVGPHFDAAAFTSLLPAFPFEPGMDLEVPVFHYEEGALLYGVRVVGDEQVTSCGEPHDAWIVETETSRNVTRHWIDKETRDVVRVSVDLGDGRRFEQGRLCDRMG